MIPIIVPARMTSRRLPGKPLRVVGGKPILRWITDRLAGIEGAAGIIVATSAEPSDDPIAAWCGAEDIACYRGSLDDVASRVMDAARTAHAEAFVRVSGDSPLMDPALVAYAIALYRMQPVDLVTNVQLRTFPKGFSVEVIRTEVLDKHLARFAREDDREHVTTAFYRHPEHVRMVSFTSGERFGSMELSIDTEPHVRMAEWLIDKTRLGRVALGWREICEAAAAYHEKEQS